MSLPLSSVIKALEKAPESIVPILSTLHYESNRLSSASRVDLKHLTSRTLNLCKSHDTYSIWCGVNIFNVLIDNLTVLSSEGGSFFTQLLKILNSSAAQDRRVFVSTVECLNKLCNNTRGKPTLTREVLTPNLSALLAAYLDKLSVDPPLVIASLKPLIQHHPTTSRPYANKLRAKLLEFISKDDFLSFPQAVKSIATSTLATLAVVEKEDIDQYWMKDVNKIMTNVADTLEIYSNFLNLKEDEDIARFFKVFGTSEEEIFHPLHVDINHPSTVLRISNRVQLLFDLLQGYVVSPTTFTVTVPIGRVVTLIELVCSINTKFVTFKREVRDLAVKEYIEVALLRGFESALQLLLALPLKYSGAVMSHFGTILSILELMVFLKGKRLDTERILANEGFTCKVIECTRHYLDLVTFYQDNTVLARVVEAALLLIEPRAVSNSTQAQAGNNHPKSLKKRAKKGGSTPLADLISHEHLFVASVPESTRTLVLEFFTVVIKKVTLSPTHYNKLLKSILVEAVKQKDASKDNIVPKALSDVLTAAVLNPAPEAASILPIAASLLWNSELLGVFINPRFPPLPTTVKNVEIAQDDDDEEDEDEDEVPRKKAKSETAEPDIKPTTQFIPSETAAVDINSSKIFVKSEKSASDAAEIDETKAVEVEVVEHQQLPEEPVEESEDETSEIEIPELDLDVSDDDN